MHTCRHTHSHRKHWIGEREFREWGKGSFFSVVSLAFITAESSLIFFRKENIAPVMQVKAADLSHSE